MALGGPGGRKRQDSIGQVVEGYR
ncbi:hypothetical protein ACNKHQ_21045 [Shigella flexneri]